MKLSKTISTPLGFFLTAVLGGLTMVSCGSSNYAVNYTDGIYDVPVPQRDRQTSQKEVDRAFSRGISELDLGLRDEGGFYQNQGVQTQAMHPDPQDVDNFPQNNVYIGLGPNAFPYAWNWNRPYAWNWDWPFYQNPYGFYQSPYGWGRSRAFSFYDPWDPFFYGAYRPYYWPLNTLPRYNTRTFRYGKRNAISSRSSNSRSSASTTRSNGAVAYRQTPSQRNTRSYSTGRSTRETTQNKTYSSAGQSRNNASSSSSSTSQSYRRSQTSSSYRAPSQRSRGSSSSYRSSSSSSSRSSSRRR